MSSDWLDTVEDEDWLGEMAPEQVREVVTAAVFDDVSTRQPNAKPPAGMPALEGRLVAAMRALKPVQRTYLRAYIQAGCNRSAATRALNKRGIGLPDSSAVTRWFGRPDFKLALDLMKKLYLDTAGLDPDSVMIKAGRVHDEAMTPQPILYMGEPTGFEQVDLSSAMRSIEFLGKVHKMTSGDEAGTRVTLHVVNIADKQMRDADAVVSEQ
jgi:hypothetical protein